ncbi:MAG: FAD-binding protein, partial [Bryobacteraceae bacterium]
ILDFSEELAYVTVEPGVTQRQLYQFLTERRSRLWMDATGSSPECSLIGNTMERGFGHTPYGDHFAHVCGLEIVLPNCEVVETGFSRFAGAKAGESYRWGVGPSVDGLFSQSNLGIVTRMTIWLMPAPPYFQAFYFRCDGGEDLAGVVDALRPLRLNGTLRSAAHIANDYKVLSSIQQYPWEQTGGKTPLAPADMERFRRQGSFGAWNGSGALYGTRRQVAEARRLVRTALRRKVAKLQFLDEGTFQIASRFAKPFRLLTGWDLSRTLELIRPTYGLMKGIPTNVPMASTYWRKRTPPPADPDPDRDGCGLLWCAPVAPMEGGHAMAIWALAQTTLPEYGFEPIISVTLLTERSLSCVISIAYDRLTPGEDERAMKCHQLLLARLASAGYHSYRLGIQSMSSMLGETGYNNLLRAIKGICDPNGILAPGRYAVEPVARKVSS